ncbi:MAG: DUF6320 domain-containing protein [Bacillota bacterium]|jgi:hypothetical protein|nr:DUF6320 domain-containing protein [Bacillota bacterium]HHU43924.1 hypothetical protein [Clostridiales bacterium]
MEQSIKKETLAQRFNSKRYVLGKIGQISLVQIISLFVINISLASIIVNIFVQGEGTWQWWSAYVTAGLIFAYLILRVFTSSGIVLGRQVTWLITVFNIFFNLFKVLRLVESDQNWELTFLIPIVNLLCLVFLVFIFAVRKKKFRAIIIPSLKITLVSVIPIVRLYISQRDNFTLPVFNSVVLVLAFALFINSLVLNWLTIKRITEENIEKIKSSADSFKKAGEKVATVNKKLEAMGNSFNKFKSFWVTSGQAFKEFFTFKKKDNNLINAKYKDDNLLNSADKDINLLNSVKEEPLKTPIRPRKSVFHMIKRLLSRKETDKEQEALVLSTLDETAEND